MGIPFYFKTLITHHPNILTPAVPNREGCHRLFLDYNCILHNCAAQINMPSMPSTEAIYNAIIQKAMEATLHIVKLARPTELVYLGVDGMCPRAKMVQQRKRRFVGAWRQSILKHPWDSNTITPGTAFMKLFDSKIAEFVREQDGKRGVQWMLSPSAAFGEGEHKIFQYMRANPTRQADKHIRQNVIYGLDADLILLSMLHCQNHPFDEVRLLREAPAFNVPVPNNANANPNATIPYMFLDIPILSTELAKTHDIPLEDYVILCTLLGNDFLPPLSFLKIKGLGSGGATGIDTVMEAYKDLGAPILVGPEKSLDTNTLLALFEALGRNEDKDMQTAVDNYYNLRPRFDKARPKIPQELDNYPVLNKSPPPGVIVPMQQGWRMHYYHALFGDPGVIADVCKEYIKAVEWVRDYYLSYDTTDVEWCYPYNYSPTILDVINYMRTNTDNDKNRNKKTVVSPLTANDLLPESFQLLCVLPPQSKYLLPKHLQPIMTDIRLNCVHFYPTQFKLQTFLKQYLWEAYPNLPLIDFPQLRRVFDTLEPPSAVVTGP